MLHYPTQLFRPLRESFHWLIAIASLTGTICAEVMVLDLPLERQVFQRSAEDSAEVKITGTASTEAAIIEAKATLGEGLRGKDHDWVVVAQGDQIKDGKFNGSIKLLTGGWYSLTVRSRKSAEPSAVLNETIINQVGVGDIFITAGQSNSINFGHPRQKSIETLAVYFDGKKFRDASDPMPSATGNGGTPWPILGDLISRTTRAPVCFYSATVNWLRVQYWIPGANSKNIERLVERAKWFGPHGFRAVLWVQGEADADGAPSTATTAQAYERDAQAMIEFSRAQLGWKVDWFVAGNSYIPPKGSEDWKPSIAAILSAQKSLWDKGIAFRGPDTNDLVGSKDYRHDTIHFGQRGLTVHAERWFVALASHYQWANPVSSVISRP